jgi:predicted sulfurtransferase
VKYGERFGDEGDWEGSLYIFDDRMAMDFSDKAKVIGECDNAAHPQSHLEMDPWTRSFWRGTYYVTT